MLIISGHAQIVNINFKVFLFFLFTKISAHSRREQTRHADTQQSSRQNIGGEVYIAVQTGKCDERRKNIRRSSGAPMKKENGRRGGKGRCGVSGRE